VIGVGPDGPLGPVEEERGAGAPWRRWEPARAHAATRAGEHSGGRPAWAAGSLADERFAWVVLATVEGVGDRTLAALCTTHGSARRALRLAARNRLPARVHDERGGTRALPAGVRAGIARAAADPGARLRELGDGGIWTLTLLDPDYPARLLGIPDPPAVLFGTGAARALRTRAAVAVVGTRRPTPAARVAAARCAAELCHAGVAVISGLAVGIDGAAHAAALEAGGTTVAVIGSGHRRPGPRAHRGLVQRIVATGGAVVGELPPAAHATHGTYPRRNRIISGLADAVIVIEAPLRSGALITAGLALEHGRPLWVQAGQPHQPASAGCRVLLEETEARPYEGVEKVLAALPLANRSRDAATARPATTGFEAGLALGGEERRLATIIRRGPVTSDDLAMLTGIAPGELAGLLTLLELRGLVRVLGPLLLPAGPLLVGSAPSVTQP